MEVAKGSASQNKDYCAKDGCFEEIGDIPTGQGHRSDLDKIAERCRNGESIRNIAEHHPGDIIRYFRGIRELHFLYDKPRTWKPTVIVYYGEPGTGKTAEVHSREQSLWTYTGSGWFDGYEGQTGVLFDDFGGHEFKLTYLLKLLDRYPMRVPVKGSFVQWKPKTIYMTSNCYFDQWYKNITASHMQALDRRIDQVIHFRGLRDMLGIRPVNRVWNGSWPVTP